MISRQIRELGGIVMNSTDMTRRGQGMWLVLVGVASVVLSILGMAVNGQLQEGVISAQIGSVLADAAIPGVLALSQYMLLRAGRIEPATIGVAGLSAAIIGINSDQGNGKLLVGVLIACLAALPFAFLSGFLALKAGLGYALVSAVAVLFGADKLISVVVSQAVNSYAPWMRALGSGGVLPGVFIFATAVFAAVAVGGPLQECNLRELDTGWLRGTLVLYVPAFLVAVFAGLLQTARIQAATPYGLGSGFIAVGILAVTAGGCSLAAHEADLLDIAIGALFAGAFTTYLYERNVDVSHFTMWVAMAAVAFILLDYLRLRRTTINQDDPIPEP